MQLELLPAESSAQQTPILSDILSGNCTQITGSGRVVVRVKPTGFLLNSTVIGDILNRGDCLVVDLQKGTLYSMRGTTPVTPIKTKLIYQRPLDIEKLRP